ncbi:hypothetical protein APA44_33400 [Pseudomonas aeruginosa]|nr:hypothetical protein AO882_32160 [Pseudomonas paraeruginosa]OPE06775.1 hypothetical protein APA44_33400 [Pseudomonas aeruginosa]
MVGCRNAGENTGAGRFGTGPPSTFPIPGGHINSLDAPRRRLQECRTGAKSGRAPTDAPQQQEQRSVHPWQRN